MSQAQKIYDYFVNTDNCAADQALLLAFRRAEAPYQTALLETILDRGQVESTIELIKNFHQFSPQWQDIILKHAGILYSGLRECISSPEKQIRLNTIEIIRQARYYRLADLLNTMLRDRQEEVSRKAGEVLVYLAKHLAKKRSVIEFDFERPAPPVETSSENAEWYYMLSCLRLSISSYGKLHHHKKVVLAAMYLAPTQWVNFWQGHLDPYHRISQIVRWFLANYDHPELAFFSLSALEKPALKSAALRAIAGHTRDEYILALAHAFAFYENCSFIKNLKRISHPLWLTSRTLPLDVLSIRDQSALLSFIASVAADPVDITGYIQPYIEKLPESVACQALDMLQAFPSHIILDTLERALVSSKPRVALTSLVQIIERNPPHLNKILTLQLSSTHPNVRKLAQRHLQEKIFDVYWKSFDQLSPSQQIAGGKAVFRLDPMALGRWRKYVLSSVSTHRLRAICIIRKIGIVNDCVEILRKLSRDMDQKVRSCAIAALGEHKGKSTELVKNCLLHALQDQDYRVQANAIESLENLRSPETVTQIAPFMQSSHNRVRANAIKAIYAFKTDSSRRAIKEMLNDRRAQHRNSAQWLANNIFNKHTHNPSNRTEENHVTVTI